MLSGGESIPFATQDLERQQLHKEADEKVGQLWCIWTTDVHSCLDAWVHVVSVHPVVQTHTRRHNFYTKTKRNACRGMGMHIYKPICMFVCMYVHMYIYIYTHIYI